jgi:phytanoyl-CoA hydroxylase
VPGSHKTVESRRRFARKRDDGVGGTEFATLPPRNVRIGSDLDTAPPEYDLDGAVPLEVPVGALIIIHGDVVHYSAANRSKNSRHAYAIHLIEGDDAYPRSNWLQKTDYEEFATFTGDAATAFEEKPLH